MKRLLITLPSTPFGRAAGSLAADAAELFAVLIFIVALGIWARILLA